MRAQYSQTNHDKKVRKLAEYYHRKGYNVQADISGWSMPEVINSYRPDLIITGNFITLVIEVETRDSVNSARDIAQRNAFKSWASRSSQRQFERFVV